jgi:hypothetical protein
MEEELPVESGAPGQTDADAPSDFDVPAFLRRQREA